MASLTNYTPGGSLAGTDFWRAAMSGQLQPMPGNPNEYTDPASGYSFAPKYKEFEGDHGSTVRNFDGGTLYKIQGKGDYTTPGYVFDSQGNPTDPGFQIEHKAPDFMDKFGFLLPLAAPFAASALGLGAAGGAAGATTAPVLGSTGALTGTQLGTLGAGMTDLGGGLMMTADGAIVGGAGAFAPATAAEMGGMGLGSAASGGGLFQSLGNAAAKVLGGGGGVDGFDWTKLIGPGISLAGGLLGSKGTNNTATTSTALDPRLDSAVFGGGGLVPTAQGLMGQQVPVGQAAQAQLMQVGSGLLGQQSPNTPTNPYVAGVLDDLQRRNQQMLDTSFNGIRDNAVAAGGLGDTRQGVAQGVATARAADNFTGQAANFMGGLYNADQNRLLQQQTLGAGLLAQGQQAPWTPVNNAASVYGQFRPQTTTVNSSQGGGAMGAIGGALGAAQFGKNMGWWG